MMSWDEAEARWPGCTVAWDDRSRRFVGKFDVHNMYESCLDQLVIVVVSPDEPVTLFIWEADREGVFHWQRQS